MLKIYGSQGSVTQISNPRLEVRNEMVQCEFSIQVSIGEGVLSGKALAGMRRNGEVSINPVIGLPIFIDIEDLYGEKGLSTHIEYDFVLSPRAEYDFKFISAVRQYVTDIKNEDMTYDLFSDEQLSYISVWLHNTVADCITTILTK